MKGRSNFGYRFLFFTALAVAIVNAAARGYKRFYVPYVPAPDTTAVDTTKKSDTARKLRFPIYDQTGDPMTDLARPRSIDLADPPNITKSFDYNADSNRYDYTPRLGSDFLRNPSYLTMDEYLAYKAKQDEQAYFQRRMDGLMLFNKTPELPEMYKEGLFDRIFGSNTIQVKPQGNVDVTFGGNWQNIKNPTLTQRAQKYGVFDFDMQMNINLLATIGDKLKLNISNNTKATFDYQNIQKLDYSGKEDEMLKKIEAGNVSFPLKSNLINGVQSLFGLKTQLQFGKLWVTAVVSQQKSQRKSLTIQGGSQAQQIALKAYNYEENKNFLLSQYFYDTYDSALKEFPRINSNVLINKVEIWVTNKTGAVTGVRKVMCFMDLGEATPFLDRVRNPSNPVRNGLPDNTANYLYSQLQQNPAGRAQSTAINNVIGAPLRLTQGQDFEPITARQLTSSEYSFNPQLGYIMLNTQLNPDDVLGVAFRYTYRGKVYQVGEFAADLPPDTTNQKVLFLKLLKGTAPRTTLPVWNLMMKNVYALGGFGVSKENFTLNVLYQDPGGGEKRYMPEGPQEGIPFLTLLNLDRLNAQNEPTPDGVFDFVEGTTINTQQGKIIFPVLQPFGRNLAKAVGSSPVFQRRYIFQVLYDSTKTVAQQYQSNDRYIMRGSYKSSSSSEIFLGGFNIPPGSVSVTAGGTRLVENQDYQIEYGLGRIKILNTGILNSGVPINIQYEDNATFGFQQQNFMATRFDYYLNKNLTLGGTFMRLKERPFTQKVTFGDDPIQNSVIGLDANYQTESPAITRLVDKLPIYATTASSFITSNLEVAGILPGHPKQINQLDPEGAVYIDDFEGTSSNYDLKFPAIAWSLAGAPRGAVNRLGQIILPEASLSNDWKYGTGRARLAWYTMEPTLVDPGGSVPQYVRDDSNQHYIRMVQQKDVFPFKSLQSFQGALNTFDLGYYPRDRGPYNFDVTNIDPVTGQLLNPASRWAGITRPIDNTDFESSNVQYVQFWVLDPFIGTNNPQGGSLYINLGNVSEDVTRDSRMFFENGIPVPFDNDKLDTTVWGYVPKFEQQITRAFDNDETARRQQDIGYDGLADTAPAGQLSEHTQFGPFLAQLGAKLGTGNPAFAAVDADPASDNYKFYRDTTYNGTNSNLISVLTRYKGFNNPQGNSPITDPNANFSTSATTIPESEDINRDNTLNESESYFQYRIDLRPNMQVGTNNLISVQNSTVKLPNGNTAQERWYQFKVPVQNYDRRVGGISDFRSIRFMRMFLNGWEDSVILRFATLELGRNQWRTFRYSLTTPGENLPQANATLTDFTVTSVNIEENGARYPVPYVIPPGVNRQSVQAQGGGNIQMNEQSLALRACALQDGDARGVFKEVNVDMRQFSHLRFFLHAESMVNQPAVNDGDINAFIRIGSDFTNNYYEYRKPLAMTAFGVGAGDVNTIWPAVNEVNIELAELVEAKKNRDAQGWPVYVPFFTTDKRGNTIVVIGTPNIGGAKNVMLGLLNQKKTNQTPSDDGLPKCVEVWFDEMRMAGLNDQAGYAAAGKVSVQLADLGNVNLSGSMHTQGYGNIDQKIQQRSQDDYYQYNTSTNLSLGKLMPRSWGVQLPMYVGYTQNVSTPKYNPYDQDVLLRDALNTTKTAAQRDSMRSAAQDFTSITSFNLTNVKIQGNPASANKWRAPWSIKNFDFTYSYNNQFKHNPTIELDNLNTQRVGIGYTYSIKSKTFEPFKNAIRSKSKWLALVKDFNITPLPSSFTVRNDLNRIVEETRVRNINDGSTYRIPSNFYKNFTWTRLYTLRWELTRSLSIDYSATNISRIDEPYGRINTPDKRDSLIRSLRTFGTNTSYGQSFNSNYNVPLSKLPFTDWITLRLGYSANYSWTTAPPVAYTLGNTIGNTTTQTATGDFNFAQLYNKSRWLKAINTKPAPKGAGDRGNVDRLQDSRPGDPRKPGAKDADAPPKGGKGNTNPGGKGPDGKAGNVKSDSSKKADKAKDEKEEKEDKKTKPGKTETVAAAFPGLDLSKLSDRQLDSLVDVQKEAEKKKAADEKKKKKAARKAARKARRQKIPDLPPAVRAIGQVLTMVNRVTVNYTQTGGTILPGYMDSTRFMGVNNYSMAPGFDFVYGYQPDYTWLAAQAAAGRLTHDPLFNSQFQQTYSRNLSAAATLQPHKDFRVDLNLTQTFSKSHSELYADTGTGEYNHFNPYETGAFSITSINLNTMFKETGVNSGVYNEFLAGRQVISRRLGLANPYTNGLPDPANPGYFKGYGPFSQDVLIPAFLAAYSGKSSATAPVLDYSHNRVRDNPFKFFIPMPNWRVTYNGLSKVEPFSKVMTNFVVNHSYTGTTSMNSFNSSLLFNDLFGLGFPSFIDSNSNNYIPYFQVPNVTISQAFNPLIGFDAAFKNNLTAKFEVRKSKSQSLSLIDYQIGENISTEYVVGIGFRKKGIRLPFQVFGITKLKNELIFKADIGIRDEKSTNTFLSNNISVTSRGQKVIRVSPTIDYSVNQRLTLRLFYDRQQTIPYVSNAYPTTTTRAGITLRFIFAQ
ncbi:MAG: cell surface protein SprA [Bacteroidota bacterium]